MWWSSLSEWRSQRHLRQLCWLHRGDVAVGRCGIGTAVIVARSHGGGSAKSGSATTCVVKLVAVRGDRATPRAANAAAGHVVAACRHCYTRRA